MPVSDDTVFFYFSFHFFNFFFFQKISISDAQPPPPPSRHARRYAPIPTRACWRAPGGPPSRADHTGKMGARGHARLGAPLVDVPRPRKLSRAPFLCAGAVARPGSGLRRRQPRIVPALWLWVSQLRRPEHDPLRDATHLGENALQVRLLALGPFRCLDRPEGIYIMGEEASDVSRRRGWRFMTESMKCTYICMYIPHRRMGSTIINLHSITICS